MSTHYIEEAERLADTRDDHVARQGGRHRPAARADRRARRRRGGRGLRAAGQAAGGRARGAEAGPAARAAPARRISVLQRQRRRPEGERRPTNLEDVFVLLTGEEIALSRRLGRLERPALMGVLVREIINFSSFWRSSHVQRHRRADGLPARVRLRLRLARRARSAATTTSTSSAPARSPPRCCSAARSRACSGRS